jgi:2-amino-4-hydroxy-6-hydroxymethyldihydropteridine diphosphokinase
MNTVYLLLGSNMGNSKEQLLLATKIIEQEIGLVMNASSFYATAAWGNENQPDFLNQVLIIETHITSSLLLKKVLAIEKTMGRVRTVKNAPRIIDIDILFFNNEIIHTKILSVPHPEIQNRRFVLIPLEELTPSFIHPTLNKTINELVISCKDSLNVQKI